MPANTPNKNLIEPANGSFTNDWDVPVNANWTSIDAAFGGNTIINITGLAPGTYALTVSQYQPPNIVFTGTLTASVTFVLPVGVGGVWSVKNSTTGAFNIIFGVTGGGQVAIPQGGLRSIVISDGAFDTGFADSAQIAGAIVTAEAFATAADAVVLASAESFASAASATAQSNAETFSKNASNLSSGTVPNAQLPNIGLMPGVIIQADPGGTPTGPPGTMWLFF
jgi:hypothetical protein